MDDMEKASIELDFIDLAMDDCQHNVPLIWCAICLEDK